MILSDTYSDILCDIDSDFLRAIRRCPLQSSTGSEGPATSTAIKSCDLRRAGKEGGGEEKEEEEEEKATVLIKSNNPHLAGREKREEKN